MSLWDSVITDCNQCLELAPDNMKAHYYLAQAYLALHDYDDALDHARRAHELCARTNDKSLAAVTAQVLRCKKERWEDMERRRRREGSELEIEVLALLERERDGVLRDMTDDGEKKEVEAEWEQKLESMRRVFEKARAAEERRRKVPDWAVDDISFQVMVDPVIVSSYRPLSLGVSGPANIPLLSRPKVVTRTNEHRSWSTSAGTQQILLRASHLRQRTCGRTWR